ncbi:MAG: nucleotide exchange factor GrpE [Roseburia sp.]|nr:nucleotide exchange factor GrpE [Roseburia sp.]
MSEKNEDILEETPEVQAEESTDNAAEETVEAGSQEAEAKDEAEAGAESEADAEENSSEENAEGEKKSFFKKKKDKKDEMIEELNDKLKRQMAEFENFRKRTEKEKSQMYDMGSKSIIEKILPVIDNFERGLAAVPAEGKEDPFVVGMDKVYRQMLAELETVGVTVIEAVGQEFNPDFHNAVMQVESQEYESGMIAQELQKGYMYKDTVVRYSMVAVVS